MTEAHLFIACMIEIERALRAQGVFIVCINFESLDKRKGRMTRVRDVSGISREGDALGDGGDVLAGRGGESHSEEELPDDTS